MTNQKINTNTHTGGFGINEIKFKTSHTAVRKARRFVLQGLYEWLLTDYRFTQNNQPEYLGNNPDTIAARTRAINAMHTVHLDYYHELMREIPKKIGELDIIIGKNLDRSIHRLDRVEYAALLIGVYELQYSLHIPYKVVIDETIQLNTHFGATDGFKLINAVMDKVAKNLRAAEIQDKAKNDTSTEDKPMISDLPDLD